VDETDRRAAEDAARRPNNQDAQEQVENLPDNVPAVDEDPKGQDIVGETPSEDSERHNAEVADPDEFRRRLEAKDQHIKELYDELAAARLAADEAQARLEADDLRVRDLEEQREQLRERLSKLEDEQRTRRRRREGQDRRVARLEREIERREADIGRLEDLLARRTEELATRSREAQSVVSRKDLALKDALRRVEGLEHDLEEREDEVVGLKATIDQMRAELDLEHELRRRMAEPENRLRAGIDLFNESEYLQEIGSISKSLGQPQVRVDLGEGEEPPLAVTFTWRDVTWRTYTINPGLAVEEPRIYLQDAGEDLSGVNRKPSNAHVGPGGRVALGL
jgi:ribonuclease Y